MKHVLTISSLAALTFALMTNNSTAGVAFASTFDNAASVSAEGWYKGGDANSQQNIGFSDTDYTQQTSPKGEIGGTFVKTTNIVFFGRSLGGTFTLNDTLHAEGEFYAKTDYPLTLNNSVLFGFFNSADSGNGTIARKNTLGLTIQEPGANGLRARASFVLANGGKVEGTTSQVIHLGTAFTLGKFTYDYNPAGSGSLLLKIFDGSGTQIGALTRTLSAANRITGATFDSFGLLSGGLAGAEDTANTMNSFMDNVLVTVPEPGSAALLGLGAACLWLCRRKGE